MEDRKGARRVGGGPPQPSSRPARLGARAGRLAARAAEDLAGAGEGAHLRLPGHVLRAVSGGRADVRTADGAAERRDDRPRVTVGDREPDAGALAPPAGRHRAVTADERARRRDEQVVSRRRAYRPPVSWGAMALETGGGPASVEGRCGTTRIPGGRPHAVRRGPAVRRVASHAPSTRRVGSCSAGFRRGEDRPDVSSQCREETPGRPRRGRGPRTGPGRGAVPSGWHGALTSNHLGDVVRGRRGRSGARRCR